MGSLPYSHPSRRIQNVTAPEPSSPGCCTALEATALGVAAPGVTALGVTALGATVRCGSTSWAEPSLVRDGRFYPKSLKKGHERLAHYASRLSTVEVGASRWFPPTPEQMRNWAANTPASFRFVVQGWNLLVGTAAHPTSLWPDLEAEVAPQFHDTRRRYRQHLSSDALYECWVRFRHALEPLHRSHKLGAIALSYPMWLRPGRTSESLLVEARTALDGLPVAVSLPNHRWWDGEATQRTLDLLEDLELAMVCTDRPRGPDSDPPVVAATDRVAVVRFEGRRPGRWSWPYWYTDNDLAGWRRDIEHLAEGCHEVYLLFANTHGIDAVSAAERLQAMIAPSQPAQTTLF